MKKHQARLWAALFSTLMLSGCWQFLSPVDPESPYFRSDSAVARPDSPNGEEIDAIEITGPASLYVDQTVEYSIYGMRDGVQVTDLTDFESIVVTSSDSAVFRIAGAAFPRITAFGESAGAVTVNAEFENTPFVTSLNVTVLPQPDSELTGGIVVQTPQAAPLTLGNGGVTSAVQGEVVTFTVAESYDSVDWYLNSALFASDTDGVLVLDTNDVAVGPLTVTAVAVTGEAWLSQAVTIQVLNAPASPEAPPSNVTLEPLPGGLAVAWSDPADLEAIDLRWYRSDAPDVAVGSAEAAPGVLSYQILSLDAGVEYGVAIRARTSSGEFSNSVVRFATVPAPLVAAGSDGEGRVATTAQGATWGIVGAVGEPRSSVYDIAFGEGRFVAVGVDAAGDGQVWYSPSGVPATWQVALAGGTAPLRSITYGNGRFVAVGDNQTIAVSNTGSTWTIAETVPATAALQAVEFGNTRFVAVGGDRALVSPTGSTGSWVSTSIAELATGQPTEGDLIDVTWTDVSFVAIATNGRSYSSTADTGSGWSATAGSPGPDVRSVASNGPRLVAVGDGQAWLSTNRGGTWVAISLSGSPSLRAVRFAGDRFLAVGDAGTVWWSQDGSEPSWAEIVAADEALPDLLAIAASVGGSE